MTTRLDADNALGADRRLRPRLRRHRQFRHPLPGRRCLRAGAAHAGFGRGAALRGAAFDVQAARTGGPCYRCLYPEARRPGLVPSCSEAGVLGRGDGRDGHAAGDRGAEGDPRHRREPVGPAADLGRAGDALPHHPAAPRPALPAVRRRTRPSPTCRSTATRGACLCRLSRSASCCCPARTTGRTTPSCWPPVPPRSGGRWCCSPPTPAAGRCCADWSGLRDAARDARVRARGVAGLDELREAAGELGIRMIACEAGLRAEALDAAQLMARRRGRRDRDVPLETVGRPDRRDLTRVALDPIRAAWHARTCQRHAACDACVRPASALLGWRARRPGSGGDRRSGRARCAREAAPRSRARSRRAAPPKAAPRASRRRSRRSRRRWSAAKPRRPEAAAGKPAADARPAPVAALPSAPSRSPPADGRRAGERHRHRPAAAALRRAALRRGEPARRPRHALPDRVGLQAARPAGGDRARVRGLAAGARTRTASRAGCTRRR